MMGRMDTILPNKHSNFLQAVPSKQVKPNGMETQFFITITLKTQKGHESFAKFYIGNNRHRAFDIFKQLKGSNDVSDKNMLYFEFIEAEKGLPVNLDFITCTLNQLAENCRIITKELFIAENFESS